MIIKIATENVSVYIHTIRVVRVPPSENTLSQMGELTIDQ